MLRKQEADAKAEYDKYYGSTTENQRKSINDYLQSNEYKGVSAKSDAQIAKSREDQIKKATKAYNDYYNVLQKVGALEGELRVAQYKGDVVKVADSEKRLAVLKKQEADAKVEFEKYSNITSDKQKTTIGQFLNSNEYKGVSAKSNAQIDAYELKNLEKEWSNIIALVKEYSSYKDKSSVYATGILSDIENRYNQLIGGNGYKSTESYIRNASDFEYTFSEKKNDALSAIYGYGYKNASNYESQYNKIKEDLKEFGLTTDDFDAALVSARQQLESSAQKIGDITFSQPETIQQYFNNISESGNALINKANTQSVLLKSNKNIIDYTQTLNSLKAISNTSDEANQAIMALESGINDLSRALSQVQGKDVISPEEQANIEHITKLLDRYQVKAEDLVGAKGTLWGGINKDGNKFFAPGTIQSITEARQALKEYAAEMGYVVQTSLRLDTNTNKLVGTFKSMGGKVANITAQFNAQGKALNITSQKLDAQSSIFSELASGFSSFFTMYFTTYTMVPRIAALVRSGFEEFSNYNKALLNISYTMDLSKQQLKDLGESALESARNLGIAVDDMESIYKVYANQTITAEQLAKQAAPTAILSNLASEDASTAADQIQAVMNQFDMLAGDDSPENFAKQAEHVVDVMDLISQNLALDYQKGISVISEATEVAGATAKQAGMSFEQLAAIAGTAAETTRQEGSSIGNALKTIMVRTSKASKYAGDDEIDNETLSNASKALHGIGVEVYKQGGEYREFDVIMSELAEKWDSLSDAQKANISFAIAATRQTNLLSVVLKNYKESTDLATRAVNEHGSAMKNQEKYLNSTAGHLKTLGASVSTLWIRIFQSMPVNEITGVLASITKFLALAAEKQPALTAIATAFFGARAFMGGRSFIGSLQGELAGAIGLAGKLQAILNSFGVFGKTFFTPLNLVKPIKDALTEAGESTSIRNVLSEMITGNVRRMQAQALQVISEQSIGMSESVASELMSYGAMTSLGEHRYGVKKGVNFKSIAKELRASGEAGAIKAADWIDDAVIKGTITANGELAESAVVATAAMEGEAASATALSSGLKTVLTVAGIVGATLLALKVYGWFNDSDVRAYEKANSELDKYKSKLDEVNQKLKEYNDLKEKRELNQLEKDDYNALDKERQLYEQYVQAQRDAAIKNATGAYQRNNENENFVVRWIEKLTGANRGKDALQMDMLQMKSINQAYKDGSMTILEYRESMSDLVMAATEWMEVLNDLRDEQGNIPAGYREIYTELDRLTNAYLENTSVVESSIQSTNNYQSYVSALSDTFYDLRTEVMGAKSAADELKKSLDEINNEGDALGTYKEVITESIEDAKDTVDGTRKFWTTAESVLGADRLQEIDYDFDTAYKEMKKLNKLTDGTAESTYDFYDKLYQKRDKLAKYGVTVTKDAEGSIEIDGIDSENIAKVADKMNVSIDVLEALFDAAGRWAEFDWSDSSSKGKGNKKSKKKAMKKLARSKENTGNDIYEQYEETPEGKKKYKYKNKYVWADATRQQVISQGTSRDWYKKGGARDQFVETAGGEQYLLSFNKRDYTNADQFLENLNAFSAQLDKDLQDAGEDLGEFGYTYAKKIGGVQHYNSLGMTYQMQNAGKTSTEIAEWFHDALDKGGVIDFFDQEGKAQTVTKENLDELAREAGYGADVDKYLSEIVSGLSSENIDMQAGVVNLMAKEIVDQNDNGTDSDKDPDEGLIPDKEHMPSELRDKYKFGNYAEGLDALKEEMDAAEEIGYDLEQVKFGNIDTNDAGRLIEWSDALIDSNKNILDEMDIDVKPGDTSTVMGSWGTYGEQEIPVAFSPIMSTENGGQLLDPGEIDAYINAIITQLESEGKPVNLANVLELDSSGEIEGFEHIKNIIADVGDTAEATSQQMHFAGVNGSIQLIIGELATLEDSVPGELRTQYMLDGLKESKLSLEEYKKVINNLPKRVDLTVNALASTAINKLKDAWNWLKKLDGKNVTTTVTTRKVGGGKSGSKSTVDNEATGGESRGGWALTGELGREIVWSGDHSYIVGEDHPEMVYLKKGDYVYNNKETEQILSGKSPKGIFKSRADTKIKKPSSSGSGSGSGKGKGKKKKKKKKNGSKGKSSSSQFNWIERSIQKIEYEIDKLSQKAENAHNTFATRAKATVDELKKVTTEIKEQQQAVKDYTSKANKVTYTKGKGKKKKEVALPDKYKKLVESGRYDIDKNGNIKDKYNGKIIETVKGSLADAIKEYQDYIDKIRDAEQKIAELQEKRLDLAAQKLDLIESKYDGIISVIEGRINAAEKANELLEAQGKMMTQNYYQIQLQGTNDKLAQQKKELAELQKALVEYEKTPGASKSSEEWYNLNQKILDCKDAIADTTKEVVELEKAIRQLDWDIFDQAQEYLTNIPEELQFMIDTISHRGLYYDLNTFWDNDYLQGREVDYTDMEGRIGEYRNIGRLNERGLAVGALYFTKYESYVKQAEQLGDAVAELNEQIYNQSDYDKELVYRRNELLEQQQEAISNALSEKEAIKDLVSEGYEMMIDALDTLIDKRKDALQATKDLYDYQNDIEEKTTNISSLQKQLASIRNDNSEEANARRSQLTKSLRDAQKDLQDTQYDRWLNDQSDMLDDLFNRYNTYVDNKISDIDTMFEDLKVQVLNQGDTINTTIKTEMDRVAYQMLNETQEVLSVWSLLNGNVEGVTSAVNSNGEFIGNELYGIGVTASDALANQIQYSTQLLGYIEDANGEKQEIVAVIGQNKEAFIAVKDAADGTITAIDGMELFLNENTGQLESIVNTMTNEEWRVADSIDGIGASFTSAIAQMYQDNVAQNEAYTKVVEDTMGVSLLNALNGTGAEDPFFKNLGKQLEPIIGDSQSGLQRVNDSLVTINKFFENYFSNLSGVISTGQGMDNFLPSIAEIVDRIVNPDKYNITDLGDGDSMLNKPSNNESANNTSSTLDPAQYHEEQKMARLKKSIQSILTNNGGGSRSISSLTMAQQTKMSELDRYLYTKYGIDTTNSSLKKSVKQSLLTQLDAYSQLSTSATDAQLLTWLKNNGFAKGGTIGRVINQSGEDGFVLARTGEEVLSIPKLKLANEMVSKLIQTSFAIPKSNAGNISKIDVGGITFTVENMNLPNVKDANEFSREFVTVLQNDNNVQKAIRSVTTDLLSGKNSLSVKRF